MTKKHTKKILKRKQKKIINCKILFTDSSFPKDRKIVKSQLWVEI